MDTRSWQKKGAHPASLQDEDLQDNHLASFRHDRKYYEGTPSHNHLPHGELINGMKRGNAMKLYAKSAGNVDVAVRTIASGVSEKNVTARRLGTHILFIHLTCR